MARAKELALRAARTPATVLLLGESGTGKEMFAHAIHHASERREQAFIRVNCAAIPDTLLESALFGYEGGAFTGARPQGQRGHFEEADGGTLFLDEIADAPLAAQAKLLRALQEREIVRVGSSTPRPVDVRLVAATHDDLDALVASGRFRQDLFYRLSVMPIRIPPLRERREDIPGLARSLLARICAEYRLVPLRLSQDAVDLLARPSVEGKRARDGEPARPGGDPHAARGRGRSPGRTSTWRRGRERRCRRRGRASHRAASRS